MMLKKIPINIFTAHFSCISIFFYQLPPSPHPPHSPAVHIVELGGFMRNGSSQGGVARRDLAAQFGAHFRLKVFISRLCHLPRVSCPAHFTPFPQKSFVHLVSSTYLLSVNAIRSALQTTIRLLKFLKKAKIWHYFNLICREEKK